MNDTNYNGYTNISALNSMSLNGSDAQPSTGSTVFRYGPTSYKAEISNNGGSWLVIGAGPAASVAPGTNITITNSGGNDVIATVGTPTFTDVNIGSNSVLSTINTVNNSINQAVLTTSSPTFNNISATTLTTSSTINGVPLSSFYTSYNNNVNQAVLTTSTPTFQGINIGPYYNEDIISGYITHNATNSLTGQKFTWGTSSNMTLDSSGVTSSTINAGTVNATTLNTGYINNPTDIQSIISGNVKVDISNSITTLENNNVTIIPAFDSTSAILYKNAANRVVSNFDSTQGSIYYNGGSTYTSGSTYNAINVLAPNNNIVSNNTGLLIGTDTSTNDAFSLYFNYQGINSSNNSINITPYNSSVSSLSLLASGYAAFGTQFDVTALAQVYHYGSGSLYRSSNVRINSGSAPSGRNRLEFYGINGTYTSGNTDQSGYTKSIGYTFQQTSSGTTGPYVNVLDIDVSAVTLNSTTPLVTNILQPLTSNVMYIQGSPTASINTLFVTNNTANSYGIQTTINGSNAYVLPINGTSITTQSWVSGTTVNSMVNNTTGMTLDYLAIGTHGQSTTGGLQMSGTNLQYYNGTTWVTVGSPGSNIFTNYITTYSGSPLTIRGSTNTTTATADFLFSNCGTDNTGYYISPVGSTNTTYTKASNSTGTVQHQAWMSGTPTTVLTMDTKGVTANFLIVGPNTNGVIGSLRTLGDTIQFLDSSGNFNSLQKGTNSFAQISCGLMSGSPSHSLVQYSSGVTISNTTNSLYVTINWPITPLGYSRVTSITINQLAYGTQTDVRFTCNDTNAAVYIYPNLNGGSVAWSAVTSGQMLLTCVSTLYI